MKPLLFNLLKLILILPTAVLGYIITAIVVGLFLLIGIYFAPFQTAFGSKDDLLLFINSEGFNGVSYMSGAWYLFLLRFIPSTIFFLTPSYFFPENKKLALGVFFGVYLTITIFGLIILFGFGSERSTEHIIKIIMEIVFMTSAAFYAYQMNKDETT